MSSSKKEVNIINFIRGICVFLMFYGHCIQQASLDYISYFDNRIFRFIYSFHMPLFMIVSGWCFYYSFCKRDLFNLLAHRVKTLIVPIISCGLLGLIFIKILPLFLLKNNIYISFQDIKDSLNLFWFLWSIIACSIPVAFAYKITNNKCIRILIICLGLIVTYLLPNKIENIYMYPYFVFGFLLSKNYKSTFLSKFKTKISWFSVIIFIIMLFYYNNDHYIYTTGIFSAEYIYKQLCIDIFRYIIGFVGSISMCYILELIYNYFIKINRFTWLLTKICYLGLNSIKFYTLSVIFLSYYLPEISYFVSKYIEYNMLTDNVIVYDAVMFAVAIFYCIFIKSLIKILDLTRIDRLLYCK